MYIQELSVVNFKNFEHAEFKFSDSLNCFIGNNGCRQNEPDGRYLLPFVL